MSKVFCTLLVACLFTCLPTSATAQHRPIERGRLVSARNFHNPSLPAPLNGVVEVLGQFTTDTLDDPLRMPGTDPANQLLAWRANPRAEYAIELGGVSVFIGDEPQPIISVSPSRILIVPRTLTSWLVIKSRTGQVFYAPLRMVAVAPALEPTGAHPGKNIALGLYFLYEDPMPNVIGLDPIPCGTEDRPTRVLLLGSGFRNAMNVSVQFGGFSISAIDHGPFVFEGTDAVVFDLHPSMTGAGEQDVQIVADGLCSNAVRITL